jgi:hypothetical protein
MVSPSTGFVIHNMFEMNRIYVAYLVQEKGKQGER